MRISDWSADVCSSDLDPGLFGILAGDLGQFLAALLVQFGDRNADQGAVRLRIKAESAGGDRLLHRLHVRLVPDLHADHARLGHTDRADLVDRSEEHTSELQSLMRISYAVFCLKKKTNT